MFNNNPVVTCLITYVEKNASLFAVVSYIPALDKVSLLFYIKAISLKSRKWS